jgi:hypothetical protein
MIETPSSSGRVERPPASFVSSLYERLWFHTVVAASFIVAFLPLRWRLLPFSVDLVEKEDTICVWIAGTIERRAVG